MSHVVFEKRLRPIATAWSAHANTSAQLAVASANSLRSTRRLEPLSGCPSHRKQQHPFNLAVCPSPCSSRGSKCPFRVSSFAFLLSHLRLNSPSLKTNKSFVLCVAGSASNLLSFRHSFFEKKSIYKIRRDAGYPLLFYSFCPGRLPGASMSLLRLPSSCHTLANMTSGFRWR